MRKRFKGMGPAKTPPASAISTRGLPFPTTYGQRKAKRSKSNNFDIENRTVSPLLPNLFPQRGP